MPGGTHGSLQGSTSGFYSFLSGLVSVDIGIVVCLKRKHMDLRREEAKTSLASTENDHTLVPRLSAHKDS